MKTRRIMRALQVLGLALVGLSISGCWHVKPTDPLMCGYGTVETLIGSERHCVVLPLSCGKGTFEQEQATGGERECTPETDPDILKCGTDTLELEQATGGERECIPMPAIPPDCDTGEIAYVTEAGEYKCRPIIVCGEGTYEQATGGERECVPDGSVSECASGTQEQATGGERECVKL